MSSDTKPPSDEEDLLAKLCDFEFEEATFENWKNVHDSLDISVTRVFSLKDLKRDSKVAVQYTQTTLEYHSGALQKLRKEKKIITLELHDKSLGEHTFAFEGLGDCKDQQSGDLKVIVVIKD